MEHTAFSALYSLAHQHEHERMQKFIADIADDLSGSPLFLNFFAPKGFGKTALLKGVWNEYERVMPTGLVCVDDFRRGSGNITLSGLLVSIVRDLSVRVPQRVAPLPSNYADWTDTKQLGELLLSLVEGAIGFKMITLLLIDDYDSIPGEQRRWLQKNVFSPASRTRRFGVVLTSETELRFTESFDLRMRLECRELAGLNSEAISRALPEYEEIAGKIYRITGGLPLLTEEFVEQLKSSQVRTLGDFQAHAQELTGKYYRSFVEDSFLADLSPNIRETMLVLALLRRFDVKVLKKILPDLLPEPYQGYGTADYLDLIDRLRPWVEWRQQGGYVLNPSFRLMLEGYILTIRPDLYRRGNRAAEKLYREWLKQEFNEHYLIELLYHTLVLHRAEINGLFPVQVEVSQVKVQHELLQYLIKSGSQPLEDVDTLVALRNSLEQDPDLKTYISEDIKRGINDLIEHRSREVKPILRFPKDICG